MIIIIAGKNVRGVNVAVPSNEGQSPNLTKTPSPP